MVLDDGALVLELAVTRADVGRFPASDCSSYQACKEDITDIEAERNWLECCLLQHNNLICSFRPFRVWRFSDTEYSRIVVCCRGRLMESVLSRDLSNCRFQKRSYFAPLIEQKAPMSPIV